MNIEAKVRIEASTLVRASLQKVVAKILEELKNVDASAKVVKFSQGSTIIFDWEASPDYETLKGSELAATLVGDLKVTRIEEVNKGSIRTIHFMCEGTAVYYSCSAATITVCG